MHPFKKSRLTGQRDETLSYVNKLSKVESFIDFQLHSMWFLINHGWPWITGCLIKQWGKSIAENKEQWSTQCKEKIMALFQNLASLSTTYVQLSSTSASWVMQPHKWVICNAQHRQQLTNSTSTLYGAHETKHTIDSKRDWSKYLSKLKINFIFQIGFNFFYKYILAYIQL